MNIKHLHSEKKISKLLRAIDQPARLKILLAIGRGEACVCHLEALLSMRQAYISQHLMALRKAGILATRREGRYIFYHLRNPRLLDLIETAGVIANVEHETLQTLIQRELPPNCECPSCEVGLQIDPSLAST
ncbi:MAG: metalloregulator ArsR/SmtB family transcription factor [Anaerolineales bacterium]|jgi:DNA-binding transcriptional ArsR family regulator|nr:metalloregulator ArsR/SmtB family transcription factor [Anaerolineales bacterium]